MKIKKIVKKLTPEFLLDFYHYALAFIGSVVFLFPSRKITVIGVTGTSGKSTTVDFITRILEEAGNHVASVSSVRFKIGKKEWKNELKMTTPGRMKLQQFLRQAVQSKCDLAVLEIASEGIKQHRHKFIHFDTAVFTNLSPEHIEAHGGFENYRNEKLKLFKATKNVHIVNIADDDAKYFWSIGARQKIGFKSKNQTSKCKMTNQNSKIVEADDIKLTADGLLFKIQDTKFNTQLLGDFNVYNALAAIAVARAYGVSLEDCRRALEKAAGVPGRMEMVSQNPMVVVDYAHTPEQLELAYKSFHGKPLVCVLGSCGGGRDKWKRPALGKIAQQYCKEIIITNEDPYDEPPLDIINQVAESAGSKAQKILDRKEAIVRALALAKPGEAVIITGKGSEVWMCLENGKKIPWSDKDTVKEELVKTLDK